MTQAMTTRAYIEAAMTTVPPELHVFKSFTPSQFYAALIAVSEAASVLNYFKKAIVYGRDLPDDLALLNYKELTQQTFGTMPDEVLHGIVGIITESGELADLALATIFGRDNFDEVNLKEELGDQFWYIARICARLGWDFSDAYEPNIKKLEVRHKLKGGTFNPDAATEAGRDRAAELEAMTRGVEVQTHAPALDDNGFPRRNRIDLFTPAETAIYEAQHAVEGAGADPRLTDATNQLQQARDSVADFVEGVERREPQANLGYATTNQLLRELEARATVQDWANDQVAASPLTVAEALAGIREVVKQNDAIEYRTVDAN